MTEWKKYSPLVELDSDTPLNQVQDQLVAGGDAIQELLLVEHPNADAVRTAIQDIKDQLDFEDISDTWVTAHVRVGKNNKLIANKRVRQVSPSIFFHLTNMLTCM
jgi:hypothetical protein